MQTFRTKSSTFRLPFIGRLVAHIRRLSPGDKAIAAILGAFLCIAIFWGLYTLERQFLVEVPSHGGSLTEGEVGAPRFVNPLLAISDADRDLTALTYAGLMGYDASGNLVPVLAESYDESEDGKTYTFVIRQGAKFSDGSPVTADDVVFTVNKAKDPALKSPALSDWANITAEAVDSRTVKFTLPKAYAPFLSDATLGILPADLWRDVSDEEFPFSPLMAQPVGAGPFVVTNVSRDKNGVAKQYSLKAFAGYALGAPYLDALTLVYFADSDELADALSRGRVESAYGVASADATKVPYSRVFGVFFNQGQNPLFAHVEVRKALSVAVDRDALVKDVLGGYGTPLTGPVPPGLGADIPAPLVDPDPVGHAKQILSDAGWSFSTTTNEWSTAKDTLTVNLTTANVPELKALADKVKQDWEAIGVPVTISLYDPGDLSTSVIRPRKYDALLFGMVIGRDRDLFAFWDSSERNDPGLNIALYANRSVDDLLEKLRGESDASKVASDLGQLNTLIAADYPAVFLDSPDFLYTLPNDLKGVSLSRIAAPTDRLAGIQSWYRESEWVWPAFATDSR